MSGNEFGELLKAFRLRAGYGLRRFATMVGELPSNYCAVETGARVPWRTMEKLRTVANALTLEEGSRDWDRFFVAAGKEQVLPPDLSDMLTRELNLVLLRTVHELQLPDEQLQQLVEYVRSTWSANKRASQRGRTKSH